MFNDIEELTEEIEIFRSNIKESSDMFDALKNISTQIEKSKEDLDTKYNSFLKKLETLNDDTERRNDMIIKNNIEIVKQQQSNFENGVTNIVDKLEKLQIDTEQKNDAIIKNNVEVMEQQQTKFEKNATNIIDRLNNLQIDALLIEIEKANKRIVYTYVFLTIIVVINIIILLK